MVLRAALALLCSIFALLAPAGALGDVPWAGAPIPFEASLHAQLLMRAVTGSVYPAATHTVRDFVADSVPTGPYEFELRKHGIDFPSVGHTMVGWVRLQQLYEALRTCALEGVPGDFLEAGVWRGGASIFAASVLREMGCLGAHGAPGGGAEHNESCVRVQCARDVWVCDSFQGFEPDPWDGDRGWTEQNPVVAVSEEAVRDNFHNYGLGAFLDESIHFVKGFFVDTLPRLHQVKTIAVLRMDGDLFSSTSDILYNLYDRVAIGGFIVVDDYGIEQCADAVDSFRNIHGITDALTQIDSHSKAVYWRKSAHVDLQMDVYYRYTFQKDLKRGRQRHPEDAVIAVTFGPPQCVEQQEREGRVSFACEAFDTHVRGDLVTGVEYRVRVQIASGESIVFAIEQVLHPEDTVISSQLPCLPMEPHAVGVRVLDAFPGLSPEERVLTAMTKRVEVRKSGAVTDRAVLQETMGSHTLGESAHCAAARPPAPFEASFHAQLLMRVVTGSVYPAVSYTGIVDEKLTTQPYEHFVRKYGLDWPSVGHTMVGWVRLQQLYEALRTCALEGVPGDFLEAGVWRGGASIFAASVLREMGCLGAHGAPGGGAEHNESCVRVQCARDVWVCDSFQGFEPDPWDGDRGWTEQNPVVAVSEEAVRDNFHNYGLGAFLDESIHFVKGFFVDTLPRLHQVKTIAVLRMDGDLFSSTSDILYNLYDRVAIGGFIVVDDYGIEQCADAVDSFRNIHGITDALTQIDSHSKAVYWRKSAHVDLQMDVYYRYTFQKTSALERARNAENAQFQAEQGQAVAETLRDQALQEVATLHARIEALEAENARMFAFCWEKEMRQIAQENAARDASLSDLMKASGTDKLFRHGYHRFYEGLLEPLRYKTGFRMLEIGVDSGNSMKTWVKYFENAADDGIQGVMYHAAGERATSACEIEKIPGCEKMRFFNGDQSNKDFLTRLIQEGAGVNPAAMLKDGKSPEWDRVGWDLIIDDGSHVPRHMLVSFITLYPFVRPGGIYVIEDIETSYLDHPQAKIYGYKITGAGVGKPPPGNFVEKMKQLIDVINRDWFYHPEFSILGASVDHSIRSITFAGGMIWVQKSFTSDAGYPKGGLCDDGGLCLRHLKNTASTEKWMREISKEEQV